MKCTMIPSCHPKCPSVYCGNCDLTTLSCRFPYRYDNSFYDALCCGDVYALAAVYCPPIKSSRTREEDTTGAISRQKTGRDSNYGGMAQYIVGVITLSQKPNVHLRPDVSAILFHHN